MSTTRNIHLTVAAIARNCDKYLFVIERDSMKKHVFNQPAGHLEAGESLQQAVIREVKEETGTTFTPEYLVGFYHLSIGEYTQYFRACFAGYINPKQNIQPQDTDIEKAAWLTRSEVTNGLYGNPRSPLVIRCLDDFEAGNRYPLSLINQDYLINKD